MINKKILLESCLLATLSFSTINCSPKFFDKENLEGKISKELFLQNPGGWFGADRYTLIIETQKGKKVIEYFGGDARVMYLTYKTGDDVTIKWDLGWKIEEK